MWCYALTSYRRAAIGPAEPRTAPTLNGTGVTGHRQGVIQPGALLVVNSLGAGDDRDVNIIDQRLHCGLINLERQYHKVVQNKIVGGMYAFGKRYRVHKLVQC
jgi:hypothetical protein